MKLSAVMMALAMLGAAASGPALAQSPSPAPPPAQTRIMPKLPPGALPALVQVDAQCKALAATYQGGMLTGKIAIGDEPITDAMKASNDYPTDAEAVVLRGYLGAVKKCAELQMEFLKTYASWDIPSANILNDGQQPVYFSLMSKEITYGMANRNLAKAAAEARKWQDENWPKIAAAQGGGSDPLDDAKAAERAVAAKCDALYAPFTAGPLNGKMALTRTNPPTPQMLMNHDKPSDAETGMVKAYQAAVAQCADATIDVYRNYAPQVYLPEFTRLRDLMTAVLADLAARRLSFGEANQKLYDINVDATARLKAIAAQRNAQKAATNPQAPAQQAAQPGNATAAPPAARQASQQTSAGQAGLPPGIQAAYQDMNQRCAALVNPFRTGVLAGKIAFDYHKVTPAMLADTSIPDDAQAAAVNAYAGGLQLCSAYETRYVRTYLPWLQAAHEHSIEQQLPVFAALDAKTISFSEAARKIEDIRTEADAESKAATEARKSGGVSAAAISQGRSMFESLQPGAQQ